MRSRWGLQRPGREDQRLGHAPPGVSLPVSSCPTSAWRQKSLLTGPRLPLCNGSTIPAPFPWHHKQAPASMETLQAAVLSAGCSVRPSQVLRNRSGHTHTRADQLGAAAALLTEFSLVCVWGGGLAATVVFFSTLLSLDFPNLLQRIEFPLGTGNRKLSKAPQAALAPALRPASSSSEVLAGAPIHPAQGPSEVGGGRRSPGGGRFRKGESLAPGHPAGPWPAPPSRPELLTPLAPHYIHLEIRGHGRWPSG